MMFGGTRGRAVLLLVGIFLAGTGVGLVGARLIGPRLFGRGGPPSRERYLDMLAHRLELRPAQRDSVQAILERRRPQLDSLWGEFHPRVDSLERGIAREIETQLDPDQRPKFEEMRRKFEERHRRLRPPPGPPPISD